MLIELENKAPKYCNTPTEPQINAKSFKGKCTQYLVIIGISLHYREQAALENTFVTLFILMHFINIRGKKGGHLKIPAKLINKCVLWALAYLEHDSMKNIGQK